MPACAQANGGVAHDRSRDAAGSPYCMPARSEAVGIVRMYGRWPLQCTFPPKAASGPLGSRSYLPGRPHTRRRGHTPTNTAALVAPHARMPLGPCAFRGRLQRMPRGKCYHALSWGLGSSRHCSVERGICHYDVLVVENDCVCRTARFQLYCLKSRDGAIEGNYIVK